MKFSLVLATIGRVAELDRFLKHLALQQGEFELIVIDQNPDDRLVPLLDAYGTHFEIVHLRCAPGLSKARNVGLGRVTGDVVAFPDDDCWYPEGLLERVRQLLRAHPERDGVTGCAVDEHGRQSSGNWDLESGWIALREPWRRAISFSIFLRRRVTDAVGSFDESLGVGSATPWQSGEETDYVMRSIASGFKLWYQSDLAVCHPNPITTFDVQAIARGRRYARGFGRVLRKHHFPWYLVTYWCLRSAGGLLLAAVRGQSSQAAFQWAVLRGRLEGWFAKFN